MPSDRLPDDQRMELRLRASEVFSPAAPIDRRDLFAGRIRQLTRLVDTVRTKGQHAVIFGKRGVGKTSLANICKDILTHGIGGSAVRTVKVNSSSGETFESLWRKALGEITTPIDTGGATLGLRPEVRTETLSAAGLLPENPTPTNVRRVLDQLGEVVVIFDEFDRLQAANVTKMFADTIKELSDAGSPSTVVLVGVADSIDGLVKEHHSIERALCQILMRRMTGEELAEILTKATSELEMRMEEKAARLVILLSQGLPHYTHLLGMSACRAAIDDGRLRVTVADVEQGIRNCLEDAQQSVRRAYQVATASPRKDSLFKYVLLACALAPVDELGFFAAGDLREPLSEIMGKRYEIPGYSQHLEKFSSHDRGNVLEKTGTRRRFRFRFRNPLLQPYVIMRGLAEETLRGDALKRLQEKFRRPKADD